MILYIFQIISFFSFLLGFFTASFVFAVCHRFVSIYFLSYLSNRLYRRARIIQPNEQFLIAYGGLRGAIAFSLAFSMPSFLTHRQLLTSSTLQLVVASVFIFGCTMKPLVRYLKIRSDTTPELSLLECMHRRIQLYTLAAIENLIGQRSFNAYAEKYVRLNELKLRPMLVSSSAMHNQLAVELRFMLEQLYVKQTAPHTDRLPLPHPQDAPGTAVRLLGQTLFKRVRRLSSLRRFSGGDKAPDERKRRATDEAINAQRAYSTAPASLQHQVYPPEYTPIPIPIQPLPQRTTPTLTVKLANGQPIGAATLEQQVWTVSKASGDLPKNTLSPRHAPLIAQQQQMNKNLTNHQQPTLSLSVQTPEQMQLLQLPTEDLLYLQRLALNSRSLPPQKNGFAPMSDQNTATLASSLDETFDLDRRRLSLESGVMTHKRSSQIEEGITRSLRKGRNPLYENSPSDGNRNELHVSYTHLERTEPAQVTFRDDLDDKIKKDNIKKSSLKLNDVSPSMGKTSTPHVSRQRLEKESKTPHPQRKVPKIFIESTISRQQQLNGSKHKSQPHLPLSVRIEVPEFSSESSSRHRPRASNYSVYQEMPEWQPPQKNFPRPTSADSHRGDSGNYRLEQDRKRKQSEADVQAQLQMLTYNSRLRGAYLQGERSKFDQMLNQE